MSMVANYSNAKVQTNLNIEKAGGILGHIGTFLIHFRGASYHSRFLLCSKNGSSPVLFRASSLLRSRIRRKLPSPVMFSQSCKVASYFAHIGAYNYFLGKLCLEKEKTLISSNYALFRHRYKKRTVPAWFPPLL